MSVLENLVDVVFNVIVFAFIGAMIWLYLRPETNDPE